MMMQTAEELAALPLSGIKLHVFHILKNTHCAEPAFVDSCALLTEDEYVQCACDFLERIPRAWVIMRLVSDAHPGMLIAPQWMNNKQRVIRTIESEFEKRRTFQGARLS